MPKLAESRFVSGPKDPLAVADVYEITENAIRNRAEDAIDEIAQLLGGVRLKFEDFIPSALMDEVAEVLSALSSAVKKMINNLAPGLMQMVTASDTGSALSFSLADFPIIWDLGAGQIDVPQTEQAFVEDLNTFIVNRKRHTGRPPTKPDTLNNGEGASVNKAAQLLVYSRLTEEMIRRDLTGAVPNLLETLTDADLEEAVALSALPAALNPNNTSASSENTVVTEDPTNTGITYVTGPAFSASTGTANQRSPRQPYVNRPLARQAEELSDATGVREALPLVAFDAYPITGNEREVDLDAVKLLLDRVSIEVILHRYPLIIREILQGVVYHKHADTHAHYLDLISILERIDPEWYLTKRDSNKLPDLNVLRDASPHARNLFITYGEADLQDAALIAHRHHASDLNVLLKNQYPFINLT